MADPLQNKNKPLMYMKSKEINVNGKPVEVLVPFSAANNSNMTTFVGEMKKSADFINKQPIICTNKVTSNLPVANQGNAAISDSFVKPSATTMSNFQLPRISSVETLNTSIQGSNIISVAPRNFRTNGGNIIRLVPSQLQNSQQPRMSSVQNPVKTLPVTQTSCKPTQPVFMLVPYGSNVNVLNTPGMQQNTRFIINPNKPGIVNPTNNKSESNSILVKNSNIRIVASTVNAKSTTTDTQINQKSLLNPDKDSKLPINEGNVKMQKVITDLLQIANSRPIPSVSVVRKPVTAKVNILNNNENNFLKTISSNLRFKVPGSQSNILIQQNADPVSSATKRGLTQNEASKKFLSSANISQSKNSTPLKETEDSGQADIDERKAKRIKLDVAKTWIPPASEDEDDVQIISEISASNKSIEIIDLDADENTHANCNNNEFDASEGSNGIKDASFRFKGSTVTYTSHSSNKCLDPNLNARKAVSEQLLDQNGLETLPSNKTNQLFSGSLSNISSNLIQAAPIYKVPICPQNVILNKGQVPSNNISILPKDSIVGNMSHLPSYLPSSTTTASTGAILQGTNTTYIIKGIQTTRGSTTQLINSVAPRPIMTSTIMKPCKQMDVTKVLLPVSSIPNLTSEIITNTSNSNIMNLESAPKGLRTFTPVIPHVSTKISNSNVLSNSMVRTATVSLPHSTYVSSQNTLPLSSVVTTSDCLRMQPRISPVKVIKTAQVLSNNTPATTIGHSINGKYVSSGLPGSGFVKACFTVPVIDIAKKIIILPQGNVCYLDAENKLYKGNFTCRLPKPLDKPYLISCNFPETAGETCKENSFDQEGSKHNPGTKSQKCMNISIFYKMDAQTKKDSVASKTQSLPATKSQNEGECQLSLNSCYSYKKPLVSRELSPSSSSSGDSSSSDSDWCKSRFNRTYEKKKHKKKKIFNWSCRSPHKNVMYYRENQKSKSFDTDSGNNSDIDFNLFFPEVELIEEEGKKVNIPYILPEKSPRRFKITNSKISSSKMKSPVRKSIVDPYSKTSPKKKIQMKKRAFVSNRNSRSPRSDSRKKVRRSPASADREKVATYIEKKPRPFPVKTPVYPSLLSYCSVLLDPLDTSVIKNGSVDLSKISLENLFLIFKRDRKQFVDEKNMEEEIPFVSDEETEAEEAPPVLIDMKKELENNSRLENDTISEENPPILTDMVKEMTPPILTSQVQDCSGTKPKTKDSGDADLKCLVYKTEKFTHLIPLTNVISLPNEESDELLPNLGESIPKSKFKISSISLSSSKSLVPSSSNLTKDVPPVLEKAEITVAQEDKIDLSDKTQKSIVKSNDSNTFLNDIENASQNSSDSGFPSLRIQKLREKFLKSLAEVEKITKERNNT